MGKVQQEIKYIAMLENMYGIKNKWRFSTRFYKRHPEKMALRKKRLANALTRRQPRTGAGFVGFGS